MATLQPTYGTAANQPPSRDDAGTAVESIRNCIGALRVILDPSVDLDGHGDMLAIVTGQLEEHYETLHRFFGDSTKGVAGAA